MDFGAGVAPLSVAFGAGVGAAAPLSAGCCANECAENKHTKQTINAYRDPERITFPQRYARRLTSVRCAAPAGSGD